MTEPLRLSGEAAVLAGRIRTIDRDLDGLERDTTRSIVAGMRVGGLGAVVLKRQQDAADDRRARLLEERADLVGRLKALMGDA